MKGRMRKEEIDRAAVLLKISVDEIDRRGSLEEAQK